ncbi:hypothetical protein [Alkaliphilus sp. B6464]|uniref:hypothetical protein n=1 Tax=Alkaliphilus sp. B6464 TaxID=2731219 RepID=UPI001BAD387A|nr:hypothetical protein [Alkaliphilus sp. B6464]QUH22064.1 hypothetical protein HYG84_19350 [Alkaliphilus sp. B6464]
MSTIVNQIDNNVEKAVKLLDDKKKELKQKKDARLRAETRIEENEKGLKKDYEEVEMLGFDPEKIDDAIKEMDKTLADYDSKLEGLIKKLEA